MNEDEFFAWFIIWAVGVCVLTAGGVVYLLVSYPREFLSLVPYAAVGVALIVVPAALGWGVFRVWLVVADDV